MTQNTKLINYYQKNLDNVKRQHNPINATTNLLKEKCNEYIKFAEDALNAVKNGRNW